MQSNPNEHLPDHPFWHFTQKVLQNSAARSALSQLETQTGVQDNLFLYCCWLAYAGQCRLTRQEVRKLIEMITTWHARIMLPLTQWQILFAKAPKNLVQEIAATRELANRLEQTMLTDVPLEYSRSVRAPIQKFSDACKNIATYCKAKQISLNLNTFEITYKLLMNIFSAVNPADAYQLCESILLAETQAYTQAKLGLD
jgi:hypothetical protein